MEREHDPAPGDEGGGKTQSEETVRELSADVNVNDVGGNPPQQPHHLERGAWVVDVVMIGAAVPRDVDDRRADVVTAQVLADRDEIGLDAAMRRRNGLSCRTTIRLRAAARVRGRSRAVQTRREASSISRHPTVARDRPER